MVLVTILTSILAAAAAIVPVALQYDAQAQALESGEAQFAAQQEAQSAPAAPAFTPSPMGQYAASGGAFITDAPDIISDNSELITAGLGAAALAALYFMVR